MLEFVIVIAIAVVVIVLLTIILRLLSKNSMNKDTISIGQIFGKLYLE